MTFLRPVLAVLLLATTAVPEPAAAQMRASEPALVAQTVDGTRISVEYSRPRARGRDSLFGTVVRWGEVWTPGANWATTLEVSRDVVVEGRPLPKGKYSVWMVVRSEGDWTLILDPRHRRFHMQRPDSTAEQVRFPVRSVSSGFAEILTRGFPEVRNNGARLEMTWGHRRVAFDIRVIPRYERGLEAARATPLLGLCSFRWAGSPDSTDKPMDFVVSHEGGSLIGRWEPAPFPEFEKVILLNIEQDWFLPGYLRDGDIYDVEQDMVFEFAINAGRAESFEVRGSDDKVMATGKRKR